MVHISVCAEDYELALEKDKVQERLLLKRSNKADGGMSQGDQGTFADGNSTGDPCLDQAQVLSQACSLRKALKLAFTQSSSMSACKGLCRRSNMHASYAVDPFRCICAGNTGSGQ